MLLYLNKYDWQLCEPVRQKCLTTGQRQGGCREQTTREAGEGLNKPDKHIHSGVLAELLRIECGASSVLVSSDKTQYKMAKMDQDKVLIEGGRPGLYLFEKIQNHLVIFDWQVKRLMLFDAYFSTAVPFISAFYWQQSKQSKTGEWLYPIDIEVYIEQSKLMKKMMPALPKIDILLGKEVY